MHVKYTLIMPIEAKRELSIFDTIKKTAEFSYNNTIDYVAKDIKYLIIVFLSAFIVIFGLFDVGASILNHQIQLIDIDITDFEEPILSGILFAKIFGFLFSDIVLTVTFFFLIFVLIYSFLWLTVSKSVYIIKHDQPMTDYKVLLKDSFSNRVKVIINSFISLILLLGSFFILLITIRYLFLFFHLLDSSNPILSLISVFIIIIISFTLSGYFVLPTQLSSCILRTEIVNNSFYALKRGYKILPTWKYKVKFMMLVGIIGILAYFFFGSLFILISLFFSFVGFINLDELIFFLIVFSFLVTIYFIILFELGTIVLGTLYGEVCSNLISKKT